MFLTVAHTNRNLNDIIGSPELLPFFRSLSSFLPAHKRAAASCSRTLEEAARGLRIDGSGRFLLTTHWPELCHVATPDYRGAEQGLEFSRGWQEIGKTRPSRDWMWVSHPLFYTASVPICLNV